MHPMLYRASVYDVKDGRISRRYGYLVIVMQFYPRFIRKEMIDEYVHDLAPARELLTEFKALDRKLKDHDRAFGEVQYEERFGVSDVGLGHLERLSEQAKTRDVFLICQCGPRERCHADLLLLTARRRFSAGIQAPRVKYPVFEKRIGA